MFSCQVVQKDHVTGAVVNLAAMPGQLFIQSTTSYRLKLH